MLTLINIELSIFSGVLIDFVNINFRSLFCVNIGRGYCTFDLLFMTFVVYDKHGKVS